MGHIAYGADDSKMALGISSGHLSGHSWGDHGIAEEIPPFFSEVHSNIESRETNTGS